MSAPRVDCDALAAVYGDGVDSYDARWSPVILPPALAVVDALDLTGMTRVLDVGAGTGALIPALTVAAPAALVVSVDRSLAMLRHARQQRDAIPVLGDASALPCGSATVDAVLLAYVLFHVLEPIGALRETVRVLRPAGRVGTVTWAKETPPQAAVVWDQTLDELDVPIPPAHGNHSGLDSEDAIDSLLHEAGLRPRRVWRETIEHRFHPEAFWQMRTLGGYNRVRLAALPSQERDRVLHELRRRLASLDAADYTFRGEVICSVSEHPTP